ncbi:MAG: phosphonate ABC transporter ATP-binding protein [Caldilineaceae bacterium]|nr:phosphonate ABC transporter ATP-binding protein [Caldilineaceae bacterium]
MTIDLSLNGHRPLKRFRNSYPGDLLCQSNEDPVIMLRDVEMQYVANKPRVINIANLTIARGERVALIGPSGAGKTTLLRLLNGYVHPNSGQVNILGELGGAGKHRDYWTRALRRRVGFVFQDFSLVERATVFQNVLWGRLGRMNPVWSLLGWFSETDKMAAMAAIAEVDLLPQTSQRIDTLSGGQQQRVGVARVLAQEAEIILADEPVSNLDPGLTDDVLGLLTDASQRHNATLIMSLHQPLLAQRYADRVIGLRAGHIVYDESSERLNDAAIQTIYGREVNTDTPPRSQQTLANSWRATSQFDQVAP